MLLGGVQSSLCVVGGYNLINLLCFRVYSTCPKAERVSEGAVTSCMYILLT